ncbi:MAG: glycoside hydrolase family 2 [Erysipelotrichaceae bacterium]|nr:glycoside hydrolase family 2 [Erysipelotrichaceae bacterium]
MKLYSKFYDKFNREKPLQEYPRPNLVRNNYTNLNGVWKYQIIKNNQKITSNWSEIVVPFAVGSLLSEVDHILKPNEVLIYKKLFKYNKKNDKTILHFEAVDQVCWVYLNGQLVAYNEGGYNPFSIDVSEYIKEENELIVRVVDYSETGIYAYGKQRIKNKEIWYKATAGIWQSVWLEDVSNAYIQELFITPYFDEKKVIFSITGDFEQAIVSIFENGKEITRAIISEKSFEYTFDEFIEWNLDNPFLYDVVIETEKDIVKSYFGMRKVSKGADSNNHERFFLNNKPIFISGILDQGYISDGMYTYPNEESMLYDLTFIKEMGFNMVRKHVKQENRRWYYLCDILGLLVFQDMPNGGKPVELKSVAHVSGMLNFKVDDSNYVKFGREKEESRNMFYQELNSMILTLYNYPSIVTWIPFNEGWGQFDSVLVVEFIKKIDSTRLIDHASGWFDQGVSDYHSNHVYFKKYKHSLDKYSRISFLSEFGGYSLFEKKHSSSKKPYGYKMFKTKKDLEDSIIRLYRYEILSNIENGLSGCVFTQLSDVEDECNGLFTFDRKVLKINPRRLAAINLRLKKGLKNE